jgi:capsular polysaccharide biosynthesis protein
LGFLLVEVRNEGPGQPLVPETTSYESSRSRPMVTANILIAFSIGVFIGGNIGILIVSLMVTAKKASGQLEPHNSISVRFKGEKETRA